MRRKVGDIVFIRLDTDQIAYGRILAEPYIAIYDCVTSSKADVDSVITQPIKYILAVMNIAVTSGRWTVIGHADLEEKLKKPFRFFKQDPFSGKTSIYVEGREQPASIEECIGLERMAVWDAEHVEDRILDEINGRPNKWVESLKLKLN